MTQIELDQKMHEINVQQNGEYKELDALLVENRRQQSRVQEQINSAKEVLAAIKEQRCELHARRGDIARRYHAMKDQLVKGNPKAYGTPTDRGGGFLFAMHTNCVARC